MFESSEVVDAFDRLGAQLSELGLPYERDESDATYTVHLDAGVAATLRLEDVDEESIVIAEVNLLEGATTTGERAAPLAQWTMRHYFVKFCSEIDGRFYARTELLGGHVDPPELGATLVALNGALGLAGEAMQHIGGLAPHALGARSTKLTQLELDQVVAPDEMAARLRRYFAAENLPAVEVGDNFLLATESDVTLDIWPSPDGLAVSLQAVVATGVNPGDPGVSELLVLNGQMAFGGFSVDPDNRELIIEHDLVAQALDQEELATAVYFMAASIESYGPYLAEELGAAFPPQTAGVTKDPPSTEPVSGFGLGWDLAPGTTVGDYEIEDELGAGAFGTVYRAKDPRLPRSVALKVLKPEWLVHEDVQRRFVREAELAARVSHPHLVKVHSLGRDRHFFYVAYDFVEGDSLERLLSDGGGLPSDRVLKIVQQVAGALQALHEMGAVHRDVKPANIMLWRPGSRLEAAILLDLGVAHAYEGHEETRLTRVGTPGTPYYQGPEAEDMSSSAGAALDQYALAATAYELLTGSPVFGAPASDAELGWRKVDLNPVSVADYEVPNPAAVNQVMKRALAVDPGDRYPSVEAFADALADALTPTPPRTVVPPSELQPYVEWQVHRSPDPAHAAVADIAKALLEIIEVESPVVAERAYRLLLAASFRRQLSSGIEKRLNAAVRRLCKDGLITADAEWTSRHVRDRILRVASRPAAPPRELGPRRLDEVPPRELAAVAAMVNGGPPGQVDDALLRKVLAVYGRKRATARFIERLQDALAGSG